MTNYRDNDELHLTLRKQQDGSRALEIRDDEGNSISRTTLGVQSDSPSFTGDPNVPTASQGDDDLSIATTHFVKRAIDTQHVVDNGTYVQRGAVNPIQMYVQASDPVGEYTLALQRAFAAMPSTKTLYQGGPDAPNGGVVDFGPGLYIINNVQIPQGVTLRGAGMGSTYIKRTQENPIFWAQGAPYGVGHTGGYPSLINMHFEGMHLTSSRPAGGDFTSPLVSIEGASNVRFFNLRTDAPNCTHIYLNQCFDTRIDQTVHWNGGRADGTPVIEITGGVNGYKNCIEVQLDHLWFESYVGPAIRNYRDQTTYKAGVIHLTNSKFESQFCAGPHLDLTTSTLVLDNVYVTSWITSTDIVKMSSCRFVMGNLRCYVVGGGTVPQSALHTDSNCQYVKVHLTVSEVQPSGMNVLTIDNYSTNEITLTAPERRVNNVLVVNDEAVATRTSNSSVFSTDKNIIANGSNLTLTLPDATTIGQGKQYRIKNVNATAATLATSASQTIDGASTLSLAMNDEVSVMSDGSKWLIMGRAGAFVTSAAASSTYIPQRAATVVLFGDSRTADCNLATTPNYYTTNLSWWDWGQARTTGGPVFEVVSNAGIGGNTTTQMLARFDTDVTPYSPAAMTLWGGTNDGWATTADCDASLANMKAILAKAQSQGIYTFLITETPSSLKGATYNSLVPYFNNGLRYLASTLPGIEVWDFYSQVVDPTSSNGSPKSILLRDGLHLNALGASILGSYVATKLARFGTRVSTLPTSPVDSMAITSNSSNVISNCLMTTATGGTLGTGDTGTLPSNWTSSGTPTAAYSVVARADGYGNDIQAVITASDTSSKFLTVTPTTSRFVAGSTYVLEAGLGITSPSNLYIVQLLAQVSVNGTTYFYGWGPQVQASAAGDGLTAMSNGVIRSRFFTLPAGTVNSGSVVLKVVHSQAGTSTITLGRIALRRVA